MHSHHQRGRCQLKYLLFLFSDKHDTLSGHCVVLQSTITRHVVLYYTDQMMCDYDLSQLQSQTIHLQTLFNLCNIKCVLVLAVVYRLYNVCMYKHIFLQSLILTKC